MPRVAQEGAVLARGDSLAQTGPPGTALPWDTGTAESHQPRASGEELLGAPELGQGHPQM